MAETAYDLQHFRSKKELPQSKAQFKMVQKKPSRLQAVLRILRNWLVFATLVSLVCGVLYTRTVVTELQTEITNKNQELVEQEALYAYLSFELESMTTPKAVQQRAGEMGLVPMSSNQISYVQVQDDNEMEVAPNFFEEMGSNFEFGMKSVLDHLHPL